jgi:hypothetical protein
MLAMQMLVAASALILLAACAGTPPEEAGKVASSEKQVCRLTTVTGTRAATQECHTEAEWAALKERQEATSRSTARGSTQLPTMGGGLPGQGAGSPGAPR